ncbi:hypothetical protein [Paenibacillus tengchongensis]|uniref:hypothetical protein n=1 Tax=Paenibacillus tengchongensis TaxID=2608684 RepID=UPI00124CC368|nr:hypothetical protein [Paenibacillus tengchongensis]
MPFKGMELERTYEPFHIMLNEHCVADISITHHARSRYADRIQQEGAAAEDLDAWLWQCLRQRRIKPYQAPEYNAYLIDDDTVMIAEFNRVEGVTSLSGRPLDVMVALTFLGRISALPQLRDLKGYYARLAQPRRKKPGKKRRKRR